MPKKQKICSVKQNALNEQDRLELATLLIKAGYSVRLGREQKSPTNKAYSYFVEYWEDENE